MLNLKQEQLKMDNQNFELLDILILISFYIQMDDHNNSRDEFRIINKKLDLILEKLERNEKNGQVWRKWETRVWI